MELNANVQVEQIGGNGGCFDTGLELWVGEASAQRRLSLGSFLNFLYARDDQVCMGANVRKLK